MHEMAVVTSIIDAICEKAAEEGATRVVACALHVGEIRDIHEDLLQKYFDWFSRGTAAEGVQVAMHVIPLRYQCQECGRIYGYNLKDERIADPFGDPLEDPAFQEGDTGDHVEREEGTCGCGHGHRMAKQRPHCFDHPEASIAVISGTELFIGDIGII